MKTAKEVELHAQTLKFAGDYAASLRVREQLEQMLAAAPAGERASNYNMMSFLAVNLGDHTEAERAAREALRIHNTVATTPDWITATYTFMLASVLATDGRFDDAVPLGESAIEMFVATGHSTEFVDACRSDVENMRNRAEIQYIGD